MLVFRIYHKRYANPLFAPGIAGRWNAAGNKVVYCSESIPLAFMESMVRRQGAGFNNDFKIAFISLPENAMLETIGLNDLEKDWDDPFDYKKCQPLAGQWYQQQKALVLNVPSAMLNLCNNYVLNTMHADFAKVKLIEITPLIPDPRIEELLKRYDTK